MQRILFVCHGNICRSPMAEFVMKDLVEKAGLGSEFQIDSAATSTEEIGHGIHPGTRRLLDAHGIAYSDHRSRQIRPADYADYDYIIGMDARNRTNMLRIFKSDPDNKLSALLSWAGVERDVDDPWYTGDFEATYNDILTGCTALLAKLS